MKFFAAAAAISSLAAFVAAAPAASCPEATRYGVATVSPTTVAAGDTVTIKADFTCAVQHFNHVPMYTDYILKVPVNNNGYELPYVLAHHDLAPGTLNEEFSIPHGYFWNASYDIAMQMTFPQNGTDGSPYYTYGGVYLPVDITTVNVS
ncbi:hypothetical protein OE88DRAFT_1646076 [Heliocybe sulcata]|uniref:Uncharacterized protein n=1 Tax=Heliocybe sulcata TaxID=5364 RepID=A0A5C3MX82_9AGAM|nr:hypothetical protein OE88DRAFT_1646076 [Heliocybe sulcata]